MPVEGVEPTRGFKPQRILNPSTRSRQPLSDKDLQQSAGKWTNPGTNAVDILAELPPAERLDVLFRLLAAWGVPDAMAGRIVGLLEGAQLSQ